jgi:hypothetical protein
VFSPPRSFLGENITQSASFPSASVFFFFASSCW